MNFPLTVAFRYLYGKKSTNAINVITAISITGIAIGTAALILILSVFNGFEGLMKSNLDAFNPDYKITSTEGKYFSKEGFEEKLKDIECIQSYSFVLEELAMIQYKDKQQLGTIKGVDEHYLQTTDFEEKISEGKALFRDDEYGDVAVVGYGISRNLNVPLNNPLNNLKISVPNRKKKYAVDKDFRSRLLTAMGVFKIENERDHQYVITNYGIVSEMLALRDQVSAIEIRSKSDVSDKDIRKALDQAGLEDYELANRFEQDASFLKITNIEKWTSYLIFSFVLILIIFNLIGCLWMIVLDKRLDISILQSMGATKKMIRRIFLYEGGLISMLGFFIGFLVALIFYWLQITVGIITVPEGYSISSYPMEMRMTDVIVIWITVLIMGLLASIPAAWRAVNVSAYVRRE